MVTITAAGTNGHRLPADGVLVFQLEMVFHLPGSEGMLAQILSLGDAENNEKGRGKDDAADRGDRLGEEIDDGRGEQHQEDGE